MSGQALAAHVAMNIRRIFSNYGLDMAKRWWTVVYRKNALMNERSIFTVIHKKHQI